MATVGSLPDPLLFTAGAVTLLGVMAVVEFALHWTVKAAREALS